MERKSNILIGNLNLIIKLHSKHLHEVFFFKQTLFLSLFLKKKKIFLKKRGLIQKFFNKFIKIKIVFSLFKNLDFLKRIKKSPIKSLNFVYVNNIRQLNCFYKLFTNLKKSMFKFPFKSKKFLFGKTFYFFLPSQVNYLKIKPLLKRKKNFDTFLFKNKGLTKKKPFIYLKKIKMKLIIFYLLDLYKKKKKNIKKYIRIVKFIFGAKPYTLSKYYRKKLLRLYINKELGIKKICRNRNFRFKLNMETSLPKVKNLTKLYKILLKFYKKKVKYENKQKLK